MFINILKQSFSSAHKIDGHKGKCAFLHGHNWTVEIAVASYKLDHLGMGMDFADIKRLVKPVIDELDHCYLNDLPYFQHFLPTAENVAKYIYESLVSIFSNEDVDIQEVIVWETDGCGVKYRDTKE